MKKEVLQKFIANSGYSSRRKAEELICDSGSVFVNGKLAEAGMRVDDKDEVKINGELIGSKKRKIYIKMNKPAGLTCTSRSFKSEKNIYSLLPANVFENQSLHIVGRLDKDSQGLILLTNDGALTQKLTHPSFEHEKKYIVTLKSNLERNADNLTRKFQKGIEVEEIGFVRAKRVKYLENDVFEVVLTEGKKRQIRMMFRTLGEHVIYLRRTEIGGLKLGNLKEGTWEYLSEKEVRELRK